MRRPIGVTFPYRKRDGDIVAILSDPERAYPKNFDTPKKANAMLMCLCQEAADEITRLRAMLRREKT